MMSTVCEKSTPGLRSTSAFSGTAARSSARTSFSEPLAARPMGVRMASTMTASGIWAPRRLTDQSIIGRTAARAGDRLGREGRSGGERLLGRAGPRAEEPGGERVARAGGVHALVDRHGGHGRRAGAVAPARPVRAELDHPLAR